MGKPETLSRRALNRAFLARQLLLERHDLDALTAIRRLLALQAQWPKPPFLALFSRLKGFQPEELKKLARDGRAARATAMRGTIFLMESNDLARLRPLLRPMLERTIQSITRRALDRADLERAARETRKLLARGPLAFAAIRAALSKKFPPAQVRMLAYAVRLGLPLSLAPDDSARWGWSAASKFGLAREAKPAALGELIRRYLAAFGPASVADFQGWSGLRDARGAFEKLRGSLRAFQDERGRELLDLPDAPRPGPDVEAPARLLPEFDSVALGHADRTRTIDAAFGKLLFTSNLRVVQTFLVDGFVAGTWLIARHRKDAILTLQPLVRVGPGDRRKLEEEAAGACRFYEPEASSVAVRWTAASSTGPI